MDEVRVTVIAIDIWVVISGLVLIALIAVGVWNLKTRKQVRSLPPRASRLQSRRVK